MSQEKKTLESEVEELVRGEEAEEASLEPDKRLRKKQKKLLDKHL